MPTPVAVAIQCLTAEAAKALHDAVSVARRRGHAQTTSLHTVSAMLSQASSALRDACARARSAVFSTRLQFRALELSLSVSLDRVPSNSCGSDEPPVSNSLMAAIKRSQAAQRRKPENFHLQQPCSVKVDLQHLILSILDDPVVSRVFAEAGFRSSEIKLAIIRPLTRLMHQQSPLRRSFPFPFSAEDTDDLRRIAEVLSRKRGRNPMLLGACARDALWSFAEAVERQNSAVLRELCSLRVARIGREVMEFVSGSRGEEDVRLRFEEIGDMVEKRVGKGIVVDVGELEDLVNEKNGWGESEAVRYVVVGIGKLLEVSYGRLWLIGAATNYERYTKFVGRFPSIEKDWDLHLLPILSLRSSFSAQSYHTRRCEPSILAASTVDLFLPNLPPPPRLHISESGSAKGLNLKIEDGVELNSSESATHKNLDKMCQYLHKIFPDSNNSPTVMAFQYCDNKGKDANNPRNKLTHTSSSEYNNINSEVPVGKQTISTSQSGSFFPMDFDAGHEKYTSTLSQKFQRVECLDSRDLGSCNMCTSIVCDGSQMSPTSVISVTTDLGLGMCSSPTSNKSNRPSSQFTTEHPKETSSLFSSKFNVAGGNILKHPSQPSTFLSFDFCRQVDARNPKILFDVLTKEVSWQDEAISVISKTIAGSHTKKVGANHRGDVWMNFVGPDRNGKRKIAVTLAKFLYGSQDSSIFVDLSSKEMKGYVKFRGKTTLDLIVGEYCKNPFSVVFLENVDEADVLVQNSLSQAMKTGKLTDSRGREVGVNNAIFVTSFSGHQAREPSNCSERIAKVKGRPIKITVEHVSADIKSQSVTASDGSIDNIPNPVLANKRNFLNHNEFQDQHLISDKAKRLHTTPNWHLDLNLPAEDNEPQVQQMNDGNLEHALTEIPNLWLQDLYEQVDETVVFKPFNFDALADRVVNVITSSFHKTIGPECSLQIESEVMDQLLAAAYVSDGDKDIENWVEQVLCGGFTEVQRRYNLTGCFTVKLATCSHQESNVYLPPSITMD
ncbi:hypothetical protein PHAVU_008G223600 [Phaseolus vulgaris]|uniref:Clp R domain-containing protein n=1 Tax=Phaseolus vulgaris TaxID=3885 RepID=V7B861_PHAVU|nr:hypothetical protein PHAVU_008G223600g [Phaseolus vulgaris]ESW13755.1 hypothetical protein PHAVU_008G223600g [Phaseolus vulgaris]